MPLLLTLSEIGRRLYSGKPSLADKIDDAIERNLDTLVAIRARSLRYDLRGELQMREWQEEIARFLNSQVAERLTPRELAELEKSTGEFARRVADRVARAIARHPLYRD